MALLTLIARVADGLLLSASMDDDQSENQLNEYRKQAKGVFQRLSTQSDARLSIETGDNYVFHLFIEYGVVYLCLCERSYPKRTAFAFLEEIQREFHAQHGKDVVNAARPYQFIKFDTVIQKTKRAYRDTRSKHLSKFNEDLQDVTRIMTTNIQDVLGRGEKLDRMSEMSSTLSMESRKYARDAKNLNLQLLYRQYGPFAIVGAIVILVIVVRLWLF